MMCINIKALAYEHMHGAQKQQGTYLGIRLNIPANMHDRPQMPVRTLMRALPMTVQPIFDTCMPMRHDMVTPSVYFFSCKLRACM